MDHEWIVEVKDNGGAAVTTATVALVQNSALSGMEWPFASAAATHTHRGDGEYEASAPIKPIVGDWTLIVRASGKSPVVQPIKMRARTKDETLTMPSPKTAATIAFSSEVKKVGTSKTRRARFSVKMYASSEIVFISGTEYESAGTRFRIFAENYRNGLRREKKIDEGVISTLFSTDDRSRETYVPAAGGGWLRVGIKSFGPTTDISPGKHHDPVTGSDVSVVALYQYLSGVGVAEPGRVKEVGFFSHSWPGGPILFNTSDNSATASRDTNDFDARQKDFNSTNVASWPKMKEAMASTGTWHVWGCSATTHHKNLVVKAHQHKPDGEDHYFTVRTATKRHDGSISQEVEEHTSRTRVRAKMDARFRSQTYMASAAAYLGVSVFGAPPGVGSSYDQRLGIIFIDTTSYATLYAYFKDQFGPEFAPTSSTYDRGYVDYKKLAGRAAPSAAPFSSAYYYFQKTFPNPKKKSEKGNTSLTFADDRLVKMEGVAIKLKVTTKSAFADAGKSGHLYELDDTDDAAKSLAYYMQEDGQLFRVNKDAAGKFTVLGPKV
ncbi:hypothetical protein WMF38_07560 [Sorangium sp. So ce118]